ncbi:MAG: glycosyltransferase [candidate division KSB1 bacterium]|nr:glycosyltransferase [candidate division KSB1 bacterium]
MGLPDYHTVASIAIGLVVINLVANLWALSRAVPSCTQDSLPFLSVLIPARNEARNIARCLESVLAQDYPTFEVLVLDDGSTDGTEAIVQAIAARDQRVRLIRGQTLPQGWTGKNFACHQLAAQARGEWLLFIDADTEHRPGGLRWSVQTALESGADLLTMIPRTVMHTFGEELLLPIIPFGLVALLPLALGERLRLASLAIGVGPFMLFRRQAYERLGGHRAVRNEVAEDVMLARRVRQEGGRIVFTNGSDLVDVHFYQGFRESWHGLAKSAFPALRYRLWLSLAMVGCFALLFLRPVVVLLQLWWQGERESSAVLPHLFHALINGALWYAIATHFRLPRRVAILYPVTVFLATLMMADSVWRSLRGGIGWKGRVYEVQGGTVRH